MKIVFVQLPLTDHGQNYVAGNQQSAAAALCAFLRAHFPGVTAEYLPSSAANIMSDDLIVRWIIKKNPDILCMPTYLWNAERNLLIAGALRHAAPAVKIMFGGPEVQPDSFLMDGPHAAVDVFVCGEGEWFFGKYLNKEDLTSCTQTVGGNTLVTQSGCAVGLEDCPEPFTSSMLESSVDGSVFVEMTRGCPYRCCYCNYSKNSPTVRERDFSVLLSAVESAQRRGIGGIYVLSPTFGASGTLTEKLEELAAINRSVAIHTEVRADLVTPATASLMKKAGFASLEIGLQTLTAPALDKIGRKGDPEKQIEGIRHLHEERLDIKVGIIAGLPGDTAEEFLKTIDRLADEGLGETVELYPLMVLPGTKIRRMADAEKITFQKKPPYLFLESPGFSRDDITRIRAHIEDVTGFSAGVRSLPDFCEGSEGFIRGLDLDASQPIADIDRHVETNLFTVILRNCTTDLLAARLAEIYAMRQSSLVQLCAFSDGFLFDEEMVRAEISKHETDSFNARMHVHDDPKLANRVLISHVTSSVHLYDMGCAMYSLITPILRVGTKKEAKRAVAPSPAAIVVAAGSYRSIRKELGIFAEYTELINFEDRSEMELFCADHGLDAPPYQHARILKLG